MNNAQYKEIEMALIPNQKPRAQLPTSLPEYEDGVVGLENNTFFCYMNACLQCLLPIEEMRDHFVM